MQILERRNRKHLWAVVSIVFLQLIVPDIVGAWYIAIVRPQLIAAGAQPCDKRPALSPESVPKDCDLVLESSSGARKQQEYSVHDGRQTTTVFGTAGVVGFWAETFDWATMWSLVIPAFALATALLVALVRRRWLRQVIYLYVVPIIVTAALVILFR